MPPGASWDYITTINLNPEMPFGWKYGYAISRDKTLDAGDKVIKEVERGGEVIGVSGLTTVTLPLSNDAYWGANPTGVQNFYIIPYLVNEFDNSVDASWGTDSIQVEFKQTDIRLGDLRIDNNVVTLDYDVVGQIPTTGFDLRFIQSANDRFESSDYVLKQLMVKDADASAGHHRLSFNVNGGPDDLPLPGRGLSASLALTGDYNILAVADSADVIPEDDGDPTREDNTSGLVGVYANMAGDTWYMHGSAAADTMTVNGTSTTFTLGDASQASTTVNNAYQTYIFGHGGNDTFNFTASFTDKNSRYYAVQGGPGDNVAAIKGHSGRDLVSLWPGRVSLDPDRKMGATIEYDLEATGFGNIQVDGRGGFDRATFYDSAGADTLNAQPKSATLTGPKFSNRVDNFYSVTANGGSRGVADKAIIAGTANADTLTMKPKQTTLTSLNVDITVNAFAHVEANGQAGADTANFEDSTGDDLFSASTTRAVMSASDFYNWATGFETISAKAAAGGKDHADLEGSSSDDTFTAFPTNAKLVTPSNSVSVTAFDEVFAKAGSGGTNDRAFFYDGTGVDKFRGTPTYAQMWSSAYLNLAQGFDKAYAYSHGNGDEAAFFDSKDNDVFTSTSTGAQLTGKTFFNRGEGFTKYSAAATLGGVDRCQMSGTVNKETYTGSATTGTLTGSNWSSTESGFAQCTIQGDALDEAKLSGTASSDTFTGTVDESLFTYSAGHFQRAVGFGLTTGKSIHGAQAMLFGTNENDQLFTDGDKTELHMSTGVVVKTEAFSTNIDGEGGADTGTLKGTAGNDSFYATGADATFVSQGATHELLNFENVDVDALGQSQGGWDYATFSDSLGDDTVGAYANVEITSSLNFRYLLHSFEKYSLTSSLGGSDAVHVGIDGGTLTGSYDKPTFVGGGIELALSGWPRVDFSSSGGTATLSGSTGDDVLQMGGSTAQLISGNTVLLMLFFNQITVDGRTGSNTAQIQTPPVFNYTLIGVWQTIGG
jgi:hypothetical protein